MYYSNGNYEAFARPLKPEGIENKSAYIVGSGLAGLASAAFLIRDAQMEGSKIRIFEELPLAGGSLDGLRKDHGWTLRGGREMENHFECLWDLYRSVPSLEIEGASVLDEFYWLNKKDPNFSKMRATKNRGQDGETNGLFTLSDKAIKEIIDLALSSEESLADKKIEDVFDDNFFESNFWLYWRTMFAFRSWHSAIEMRRYLLRFVHHIGGLPDFSALKFTKYNQYESLVLPLVAYLKDHGVEFIYDTMVTDIEFDILPDKKVARRIVYEESGSIKSVNLTENDYVFITNGSITESSTFGDHYTPAKLDSTRGGSWKLWKNIAHHDPSFGNPDTFSGDVSKSMFPSATLTTLDKEVIPYIEKIVQRDPFNGGTVSGGIVTVRDSGWLMSWTINRQPQFKKQGKDEIVVWIYSLVTDGIGNYIPKRMADCSGQEIAEEWLYHLGVPEDKIQKLAAKSINCVPCIMPFAMSYFMPRHKGDRPNVVPEGSVNFAFVGNFSETQRDTNFTTEYSVRTPMEAVYTLAKVDRGVPEVFASCFDVRVLMDAAYYLMDKKKISEVKVPYFVSLMEKKTYKKIKGTFVEELLIEHHLL